MLKVWVLALQCGVLLPAPGNAAQGGQPKSQWRIANAAPISSFWAVIEVEFHTSSTCDKRVRERPISSGYVRISSTGAHPPKFAFDNDAQNILPSAWWSQCDGCDPGEAWIGQAYALLFPDVECLRIYQVSIPDHSTANVNLDYWNGTHWATKQTFDNVGTAYFDNLPVMPLTLWRILLLDSVQSGWRVAELTMHDDTECISSMEGVSSAFGFIGNVSAVSDLQNSPEKARDGNEFTSWVAPCTECEKMEPWLAVNLRNPGQVHCFRLLQDEAHGAQSILVQAWSGSNYSNITSFHVLSPGIWDHLVRWEVCKHAPGTLWRFLPSEAVQGHWTVFELEMHESTNCSDISPSGIAISSATLNSSTHGFSNASTVFDDNISTSWTSPQSRAFSGPDWPGWNDGSQDVHVLGFPWFGVSLASNNTAPRCFKFLQSNVLADATSTLVVQRWNGTGWAEYVDEIDEIGTVSFWYSGLTSFFTTKAPMTWSRLPALDRTQWRVVQGDLLWNHWAVKEVHFYEWIECGREVSGAPIAAAEDPVYWEHDSRNAFDRELSTEWWSHCFECRPGQAWLGLALPTPRSVRCVALLQSSQDPLGSQVPWWTMHATIQKWNGHRWVDVAETNGLGRGAWDNLYAYSHAPNYDDSNSGLPYWNTKENTIWRVTNGEVIPDRWVLPSLNFYSDFDCSQTLDGAKQMSSGYVIGFGMENADDNDVSTEWLSSCANCGVGQAWLGVFVPVKSWVRCVRIFQRVRVQSSSKSIVVETLGSSSWVQAMVANNLDFGTWEMVYVPRPGTSSQDYRVRWRVVNAQPTSDRWSVGDLRLYVSPGCTNEAYGVQISSGYLMGYDLAAAFDGSTSTYWKSSCRKCASGQAWLGISLPATSAAVRCIQLWQSSDPDQVSKVVSVQMWASSSSWAEVATFKGLNPGAWDALHLLQVPPLASILTDFSNLPEAPAVPAASMWRVLNTAPIERSWAIRHLRFYRRDAGTHCEDLLEGIPISSGQALGYPPESALTNSTGAAGEWRSPCVSCATGSAWLGLAFSSAVDINCVEIEQADAEIDNTPSLALESWDGVSAWTVARSFAGLSGGSLMRLSASWANPAPFQRFRILNLLPLTDRWKVAELQLFLDVECSKSVEGSAVSSGSSKSAVPRLAFDGNISTAWQSSMLSAPARGAWLGLHLYAPHDVKCALIRQGDEPGQWTGAIAFERTSEDGWALVYELKPLNVGAWFSLNTFASPFAGIRVNFQDREAETPPGYLIDVGERYRRRADGYAYGWNCELEGFTRGVFIDLVWDTLVELQCTGATWDFEIMRGYYYVEISYSNPGEGGSTASCFLEGVSVAAGPILPYEKSFRKAPVAVRDGYLTFHGDTFKTCTTITALDARALPDSQAMWRVVNRAPLDGRWRIEEVEFHATTLCSVNIFQVRATTLIASGWAEGAAPDLAIDGDMATAWESPCDGCDRDQAWLGASFSSMQLVKCVRLFQSANGHQQSSIVALERWNSSDWEVHQTFVNTPGGIWGKYNDRWVEPAENYRWRLVAHHPLNGSLRIAEMMLFSDVGCQTELEGFPIASHVIPSDPAASAFDHDFNTEWVSQCDPCQAGEAWIGLHFPLPKTVMCAFAALPEYSRRLAESSDHADRIPLRLEEWKGTTWSGSGPVVQARPNAWAAAHRIRALNLLPLMLWRIVNNVATTAPWRILELEFHAKADCDDLISTGDALSSSEQQGFSADLAFDGSAFMLSSWIAGCSPEGCAKGSEWIGKLFPQAYIFQCVRIYQGSASMAGNPAAESIRLEQWNGTGWELTRVFTQVRSGTWVDLLVLNPDMKFSFSSQEWRVVAESYVSKHWAIAEISLYEQVECKRALVGTVSASGQAGSQYVKYAIDGRVDTAWWSQGNLAPREAWIGFSYGETHVVRCVRLLQDVDPAYSAKVVQLQARWGLDWLHINSLSGVALGEYQHFHIFDAVHDKKAGAMYRLLNYNDVADGWALTELEFYSDLDCNRIEIGKPISSGFTNGQAEPYGMDVILSTHWRSQCRNCPRFAAWLGQSFYKSLDALSEESSESRAVEVQCVILLQGSRPNNATSTVVLEAWSGSKWQRVEKFTDVPGSDFVQLRVGQTGNASVQVDAMRKALMMVTTPSPEVLAELRQTLRANNDVVEMDVTMFVSHWPVELTTGRETSNNFAAAWSTAVRKTLADRTNQPDMQVFVDNAILRIAGVRQGEAVRPSLIARASVYVTAVGSTEAMYTTDSQLVQSFLDEVAADPLGVEALFMVELLKNELRAATRLEPILASVALQIEDSISVSLGKPVLRVAFETTEPPTTAPPTAAPAVKKDTTVLYIMLLVSLVLFACLVRLLYVCYQSRKKAREDRELWTITHPGVPYPKVPSRWAKFKEELKMVRLRRKGNQQDLSRSSTARSSTVSIDVHTAEHDQNLGDMDNKLRSELRELGQAGTRSSDVMSARGSGGHRASLSAAAAIAMGISPELVEVTAGEKAAQSRRNTRRMSKLPPVNPKLIEKSSAEKRPSAEKGKKRPSSNASSVAHSNSDNNADNAMPDA